MISPDSRTALVFVGGDPVPPSVRERLPEVDLAVAADSGLDRAYSLGAHVDLLVGDLDSVGADSLERARAQGVTIEEHPPDKDQTDLELALDAVVSRGLSRVIVVGGHGGRLDHLLANVAVLASARYEGLSFEALMGDATLFVVRDSLRLRDSAGRLVSLLAVGGDAVVSTDGLRYPLRGDVLAAGVGRGVSNEIVGNEAEVRVEQGVVLVIQPAHAA